MTYSEFSEISKKLNFKKEGPLQGIVSCIAVIYPNHTLVISKLYVYRKFFRNYKGI